MKVDQQDIICLTNEIYGPRWSHTLGLWMLVDIDITIRAFMKKLLDLISIKWT